MPGVCETVVLRGEVGLLAPHGSSIEDGTEHIAERVARRTGASFYHVTYPGTWDEARPLHVSGTSIAPDSSVALAAFTGHCRTVIAVHGFTREGMRHTALVGGLNDNLAGSVASELRERLPEPSLVLDGDEVPSGLRGRSSGNLTNRFPEAGCQVELPPRLRVSYLSRALWGGSAPNPNLYLEAVVDALSAAVCTYTARAG